MSASVSECLIVLGGQREPHLNISFINYPKFPMKEKEFKLEINKLGKFLMKEFNQNRIVIVYHNETIMFEVNDGIDPRIKPKQ